MLLGVSCILYGNPYFGRITQAFFPSDFAGQPSTDVSPAVTKPLGTGKPLQTISRPTGLRISQALDEFLSSLLLEQAGDLASLVTTNPVGIGAAGNSRPRQIMNPLHDVSMS